MEYFVLLRSNQSYRFLWLSGVISQLGDWFNLLASAELITRLSDSGTAISYLILARYLPLFLFSPFAGVLADRYDRRHVMIVSDLLRAVTVLGFLFVRSSQQIWLLYVLTVVQFVLSSLFTPARSAFLANVVATKDLVTANALDSLTWSTMLAFGAFLGGIITAVFGADTAFVLDALTFVLSAWFLGLIKTQINNQLLPVGGGSFLDFVDGFRYLRAVPFILGVAAAKASGSLIWGAINVVEVTFAERFFPLSNPLLIRILQVADGGTATLGLIYMLSGIGTGIGPIMFRRWLGDKSERLLLGVTIGFFLMIGGTWWLSITGSLFILLFATLVRTIGSGAMWVFSAVLLQKLVPDQYRGRVLAFEFALLTLTQSASTYAAGFFQDNIGWNVFQVSAVMGYLGLGIAIIWSLFHLFALTYLKKNALFGTHS